MAEGEHRRSLQKNNGAAGEQLYEPFAGSGTTTIAPERRMGRLRRDV
jgi:hypothetical protein